MPILSNLNAFLSAADRRRGLLGLDVSKTSIGVAGADSAWTMATPLLTIRRTKLKNDLDRLKTLLLEREAASLVIGLPLNMDGSAGPRCQAIRQFAATLDKSFILSILLWDERLTTFAANERADELGLRGKRRAAMLDALAATALLQDGLNAMARHVCPP